MNETAINRRPHPLRALACLALACVAVTAYAAEAEATITDRPVEQDAELSGINPDAAFLARMSGIFSVEDPTSIYGFDIQDSAVEFIMDGSWTLDLTGALGISFGTGTPVPTITLPTFAQTVDLSAWVFLDQKWYFEAAVAEGFKSNSVVAGYIGPEDSPIKHVRVGNAGIAFPDLYPFITVGGGDVIAPGISASFGGDKWNADAVVRYDASAAQRMVLSGMNEITEEYVPVTSFVTGKWFALPEDYLAGTVSVYVEDDSGGIAESGGRAAGRRWRKLNSSEYSVSGTYGTIELTAAATGSVAVSYGGDWSAGGTARTALRSFVTDTRFYFDAAAQALGTTLPSAYLPDPTAADYDDRLSDRFLVSLDGETALLVRERGYFSPFEIRSRYEGEGEDAAAVFEESGITADYLAVSAWGDTYAELWRTDTASGSATPPAARTAEGRFPLVPELPGMYLPGWGGRKPDTDLAIRTRQSTSISTISLGTDVIAGTISVRRNGVIDSAFTFDQKTGLLTLTTLPIDGESIVIEWYETDAAALNATFTLAGGVAWKPTDSLTLTGGSAFRWNLGQSAFTDASNPSPGSLVAETSLAYARDGLTASTAFAVNLSVNDTTGYYRILGMNDDPSTSYPEEDWYEPIAQTIAPVLGAPLYTEDTVPSSVALDDASRVAVNNADATSLPVMTDTSVSGSVLVLSCDLPSAASWSGADILAGSEGGADFASAETVALALANAGSTSDFDVFLQLGTGVSDYYEDQSTIRTWKLATPAVNAGWTTSSITLTDDDRVSLADGADMRLIVIPTTGASPSAEAPVAVRLRSGPFEIAASGFSATGTAQAVESEDDTAGLPLASAQSALVSRFNLGEPNSVLSVRFTPTADAPTATVSRHVSAINADGYRYFTFFICPTDLPTDSTDAGANRLRVRLTGLDPSTGEAATTLDLSLPARTLTAGAWQRVTVDLAASIVTIDDTIIPEPQVALSIGDRTVSPTRVEFAFDSWSIPADFSGAWAYGAMIDEVFLSGTVSGFSAQNRSEVAWKRPGAIWSVGSLDLVSDADIGVVADSAFEFATGESTLSGTASAGFSLLGARIAATATADSESDDILKSTSHSIDAPIGPFTLGEAWSTNYATNALSRRDYLKLSGPISVAAEATLAQSSRKLARSASLTVKPIIPPLPFGQFQASLNSEFTQNGLAPILDLSASDPASLWAASGAWAISLGEADARKRQETIGFTAGWARGETTDSVYLSAVTIEGKAVANYASSSETKIASTTSAGVSAPIAVGTNLLTPSWTRKATREAPLTSGGSYLTDCSFLGAALAGQTWFWTTAPIADLLTADLASSIDGGSGFAHDFVNLYKIDWSRQGAGTPIDLVLPTSLALSVARETTTDDSADDVDDGWTATAEARFSAFNVAGLYSEARLFRWYRQDEFQSIYKWAPKWGNDYFGWKLDAWNSALLVIGDRDSLSLDSTFHYNTANASGSEELTSEAARAVWKRRGEGSFLAALLALVTELPLTTTREESATLTVTYDDSGTAATGALKHILRTGVGKNGEVRLTGGGGVSVEDDDVTITITFGIGGTFKF